MTWWMFALISAFAASATALLAKAGVQGVPSNLATAVRTVVVLLFAWGIVIASGEHRALAKVSTRSLVFLLLSGIGTGVSWLAYFRALELGPVSRVAPIDKLSLVFTVAFGLLIFREPLTWRLGVGAGLVLVGIVVSSGWP